MKKEFFENDRKKLMEVIDDNSLVILFAGKAPYKSADEAYAFTPNRNFYYLTGVERENVVLLINKRNGNITETLFIEENDPVMARWIGEKMSSMEATDVSGVNDIRYIKEFNSSVAALLNRFEYKNLYLDMERAEWDIPLSEAQKYAAFVREKYPYISIKNVYHRIEELRLIKSEEEVEAIRKAIDITDEGIMNMFKNAKSGMMEYEIEAYFDFSLKSRGVIDNAFKTIAASGENATVLHYSKNNSKTGENDLMLLDLGAQYNYYNADISRTFPVNGRFTERQRQVYNVVLKANKAIIEMARPGIPFTALNEKTREILAEGCKELGLIKDNSELSEYYFHGVSHYLGLDTHDVGSREVELKPGMVLTVEPGLYISEEGIGIRIEDDILITENGCENLSKQIIKEADEIEAYMAEK